MRIEQIVLNATITFKLRWWWCAIILVYQTHYGAWHAWTVVILLFKLLNLLQGEERPAPPPGRLLRVRHRPLLKGLRVTTLNM